jgi:hypothetical protein
MNSTNLKAGRPAGHVLWQGAYELDLESGVNRQRAHGFRPLLAESFHDPAVHQGTLYKVTNWTPLGLTKGFRRHLADFYQDLESPKQLWIHPLHKNARPLVPVPSSRRSMRWFATSASSASTSRATGERPNRQNRITKKPPDGEIHPGVRV